MLGDMIVTSDESSADAAGSSNLGMRSAELDLELQFVVLTRNEALR